ncbi:MAG: hypothetical protein LBT97_08685 [Planctomycetota bacterium]|jgi:xylulokinase|nr:hypothetical protein [Planctomycetota bacterium]
MAYIGVDVGTSGCKAAVVGAGGDILAAAGREYPFVVPRPGWVELDAGAVWRAVAEALRELSPRAASARAIAVASIGESMVLADADDRILYNPIVYVDNRCAGTVGKVENTVPARELHRLTGMPLNQMYSLNKLLWFRDNAPEVLERARKAFLFVEYIGYLLCGKRLVDPASASRTMLFDARRLDWADGLFRAFGMDRGLFAEIAPPGSRVGTLLPEVAAATGLPAGLAVILGCHDQPCGSLGSGIFDAGDALLGEGSSESINLIVDGTAVGPGLIDRHIPFEPFFEGRYLCASAQLTHGSGIRWFVELFRAELAKAGGDPAENAYALADRRCADDSAGLYFLPYLSGVDPNDGDNDARGCFVGLDVTVDIWRMYRAVLEGLSFETRMRLERLAEGGVAPGRMIAAGGATRSDRFMQMKADVLERPVRTLQGGEAGIRGLGAICAVACGDYPGYREALAGFARPCREYLPQKSYADRYAGYLAVQGNIRRLYRELRGNAALR